MGLFLAYILKSALCLAVFYLFYRLLLSRETFHTFNRFALLGILLLSVVLPLVQVSRGGTGEMQQAVLDMEQWFVLLDAGEASVAGDVMQRALPGWMYMLPLVYLAGAAFFLLREAWSLWRLAKVLRMGERKPLEGHAGACLVVHEGEIAPFSWMGYIVISHKDLEENAREILAHELGHMIRRHSWDVLLADACIVLQWFNPAAWLLKQELQSLHEYEADWAVIRSGADMTQYQLLLIKKAVGRGRYSMANSLNHSSLKKRITMMMKQKSNPWARVKYLYVLPLAAVAVAAFARPEAVRVSDELSAVKVNSLPGMWQGNGVENATLGDSSRLSVTALSTRAKVEGLRIAGSKVDSIVCIVDGKRISPKEMKTLSPDCIASIEVRKDEASLVKYGARAGEKAVMLITLKKDGASPQGLPGAQSSPDPADVLYVVDGQEMASKDFENISPERIASITVYRGEEAVSRYGDKARNGVLVVATKGAVPKDGEMAVQGIVLDAKGEPVIGAVIVVEGTKQGVVSGKDGKFSLNAPNGSTLKVMYVGFETVEAKAEPMMTVTLQNE